MLPASCHDTLPCPGTLPAQLLSDVLPKEESGASVNFEAYTVCDTMLFKQKFDQDHVHVFQPCWEPALARSGTAEVGHSV